MRLLITPSNPAYSFIVFDTETGSTMRFPSRPEEADHGASDYRPPHRPFGVTWDEDHIYVANRRALCVYSHFLEYQHKIENVCGENPHQITTFGDSIVVTMADCDWLCRRRPA